MSGSDGFTGILLGRILKNENVREVFVRCLSSCDINVDELGTCYSHALRLGKENSVRGFLELGFSPDHRDENEDSALILAVRKGSRLLVELLLEYGASIEIKNKLGKTAIDYAKNTEIKDLLLFNGAKLSPDQIAIRAFDLSEDCIISNCDDAAKALRSVAAKMGHEVAQRIISTYPSNASESTFFQNAPSSSVGDKQALGKAPDSKN